MVGTERYQGGERDVVLSTKGSDLFFEEMLVGYDGEYIGDLRVLRK